VGNFRHIWLIDSLLENSRLIYPFLSPLNGAFFVNGYLLSLSAVVLRTMAGLMYKGLRRSFSEGERGPPPADGNAPNVLVCCDFAPP